MYEDRMEDYRKLSEKNQGILDVAAARMPTLRSTYVHSDEEVSTVVMPLPIFSFVTPMSRNKSKEIFLESIDS